MNRYPQKSGKFSSHNFIMREIDHFLEINQDSEIRILDVGCARGEFLAERIDEKITAEGIEPFREDALIAERAGYKIYLNTVEAALPNLKSEYNLIILGDVLEHLIDPKEILAQLVSKLSQNGRILISVPNVANITIRLSLLFGRFRYTDRGILDRTHLRFFDSRAFKDLIIFNETEIVYYSITPIPIELLFKFFARGKFGQAVQNLVWIISKLAPNLFGYQHIAIIKKRN